jgi:hypothetical protein
LKLKKPNQIEPEPKKTEPNRKYRAKPEKPSQTRKKPSQNLFEPVFVLKNRTEPKPVGLIRFRFFLNNFGLVTFFIYKNRTEPKMITSN